MLLFTQSKIRHAKLIVGLRFLITSLSFALMVPFEHHPFTSDLVCRTDIINRSTAPTSLTPKISANNSEQTIFSQMIKISTSN